MCMSVRKDWTVEVKSSAHEHFYIAAHTHRAVANEVNAGNYSVEAHNHSCRFDVGSNITN